MQPTHPLAGMKASTKAKWSTKKIGGLGVSTETTGTTSMSVFHVEEHVILVVAPSKGGLAISIAAALISANT